ncbi:hypothetical protein AB0368_05575 [Actinoplanes sp. NPDC051475]|uniref:hypothetical protein n=1 Tax=Actinoplanes sp. NPDC051475 TaxID=3157225 RepID=UPI00344F9335
MSLALVGSLVSACGHTNDRSPAQKCTDRQLSMLSQLKELAVLDQHPTTSISNNRVAVCADDGRDVQVSNEYQTLLPPADIHTFYTDVAHTDGWHALRVNDPPINDPNPQDSGQDILCATRDIDGTPVYLEVWYPDADSDLITNGDPGKVYFVDASLESRNDDTCLTE